VSTKTSPPLADTGLLDLLPDPMIGMDAERRVVEWNRAAEQAYGFSRTEAIGQNPIELLRMSFPLPLAQLRETMAETGVWRGDVVARAKDGSTYVVDSVLVAERDEQGRVNRVLAVHRDVTARLASQSELARSETAAERERIHARMRRAQRLESIGQLAGGVAHDFNNLLAIIINYTALIVSELDAMQRAPHRECWDALRDDLGEIQKAADRAASLTHQLLAFSRQGVGNPVLVDLNDAVTSVEELLRRTIGEHIELHISLAESLRMIRGDDSQLEQMLLNLSINSRDAMPDGGTLTIDTADVEVDEEYAAPRSELRPGPYVRLRVSDTGRGMTPEELDSAFDPFFTTKPVGEGTGLGLAAVYGIVNQAGGRAAFHSEPGVGTTFTALFPAAEVDAELGAAAGEARGAGAVATILLVEDEQPLREITHRVLATAGYRVVGAGNGQEALAAAHAEPGGIDLLLTDVAMPGMLGPQLAAELRDEHPSMRVLYMTGFAGSVLDLAFATTACELIEKPFTAPELLERIAQLSTPG